MVEKISSLIIRKIDPETGELMLDSIQSQTLVRWLLAIEAVLTQQDILVKELQKIMEDAKNG